MEKYKMKASKAIISTAISGALALGALTLSQTASADDAKEKCYGVAKAGKNDCDTAASSCAGTSTADGQTDAWVLVPKGLCEKLVGGSTTSS